MADDAILDMVDAWLTYAKTKGLATPSNDGNTPEDRHVLDFILGYVRNTTDVTIDQELMSEINSIVSRSTSPLTDKSREQVGRLKTMIKDKLTPEQQQQLKSELERAAG